MKSKYYRYVSVFALTLVTTSMAYVYCRAGSCGEKNTNGKCSSKSCGVSPWNGASGKPVENRWAFLPPVVATIGEQKISKEEFIKIVDSRIPANAGPVPQDTLKNFCKRMIEGMVDQRLLLRMAESKGIKPDARLVKQQFKKMMEQLKPEQAEQFKAMLKAQNMTLADYEKKLSSDPNARDGLAIQEWLEKCVKPDVKVTNEEVKKFYQENMESFKHPEMLTASHILFKFDGQDKSAKDKARAEAQAVLTQIQKGADFAALAEKESDCPSGKMNKGSLGAFGKGQMVPEFEKAAFAMKPGEMSDLVQTKFGYHIIKVTEREPAGHRPFDKVKALIEDRLRIEKESALVEKVLKEEKSKIKVEINLG